MPNVLNRKSPNFSRQPEKVEKVEVEVVERVETV
jgi:hypothetical protein